MVIKLIVWEPDKNIFRKADTGDILEAIYILTQLIPLGKVSSYKDIAETLGIHPRIVGYAMRKNKKPIIIPCHRVVGSDGSLRNYSRGGPRVKKELLTIEGVGFDKNDRVKKTFFTSIKDFIEDP